MSWLFPPKQPPTPQSQAVLIDIVRNGRLNQFVFKRNGQVYVIETYGTLSDNPEEWKQWLLK